MGMWGWMWGGMRVSMWVRSVGQPHGPGRGDVGQDWALLVQYGSDLWVRMWGRYGSGMWGSPIDSPLSLQSWVDDKTPWTTRYGSIAGLAELGPDVSV